MTKTSTASLCLALSLAAWGATAPRPKRKTTAHVAAAKTATPAASPAPAARADRGTEASAARRRTQARIAAQVREIQKEMARLQRHQAQLESLANSLKTDTAEPAPEAVLGAAATPQASGGALDLAAAASPETDTTGAAPAASAKQSDPWYDHVKLSGLFYGDYSYYTNTGFGPQFLTQMNQEGPGNGGFNSFDITRTYLNFFFTPNSAVTLRVTPNIYREVSPTGGQSFGSGAQIGNSSNGNLGFRLKYANITFNHPFAGNSTFGKDKITFGQTTDPLVDWEEGLFGYRFIALTPWNYLSLSSTYVGADVHGPIMLNGREYFDYMVGVYNETSFHHIEASQSKSVMGRISWYPMGTDKDRTGLALTLFDAAGDSNAPPDASHQPNNTFAGIVSYQTHDKGYLVAGEFDLGENAFGAGNLYSGVGPAAGGPYADWNTQVVGTILSGQTRQRGYDFFGHARIGHTPFTLVGFFQEFQPNIHVSNDPIDFQRIVGALAYKYNKNLTLAFSSQNLVYTQTQGAFNGVANAVPTNTNALMLNVQYGF